MVDNKCGIFSTENIIIFVLVIILLALIFRYVQLKTNENYTGSQKDSFTNDNMNEEFKTGESVCTLYYANWCPHCKSLYPFFNEWRDSNDGKLILDNDKVVIIKSYEENDIPQKEAEDIEGFPTIKLRYLSYTKEYMGSRSKEDILQWLKSNIN